MPGDCLPIVPSGPARRKGSVVFDADFPSIPIPRSRAHSIVRRYLNLPEHEVSEDEKEDEATSDCASSPSDVLLDENGDDDPSRSKDCEDEDAAVDDVGKSSVVDCKVSWSDVYGRG